MRPELPTAEVVEDGRSRRSFTFEVVLVILIASAILIPGIWKYSLVDPWETHYGEVARAMLQDDDLVHTNWPGTSSGTPGDNEGFRSKPVLSFWMMAAGMTAVGVAEDGGYSGELVDSPRVMIAIRLPFVFAAIAGLVMVWWMLARLVSRKLAWLALLVVGSTPMFCMISRQAIPDMPMVACTMGAIALFVLAIEDGDRSIRRIGTIGFGRARFDYDARHVVLALAVGFVLLQAIYYAVYFTKQPVLGIRARIPNPAIWLPLVMLWSVSGLWRDGWLFCLWRLPCVLAGGVIAAIVNEPMPLRRPGQSMWRHVVDNILVPWERHAIDRYLVRVLPVTAAVTLVGLELLGVPMSRMVFALAIAGIVAISVIWALAVAAGGWAATNEIADRLLGMSPITTMRQLFLLGCYFLLGVSLLAKGPPGFTVVALVGVFHVVCFNRWSALWHGAFELKRGILLITAVAIPWHIGMWLKEGNRFIDEYLHTHILNRASAGVDNSPGTFEYYANQIGHGMWLWAALLPGAVAAMLMRADRKTREGRVRFMMALWAVMAMALFCLVQTKFHHYILPAIPALGVLVAWYLYDILERREKLHILYAGIGIGIVFLVTRDLMFEPDRWIEMMVFRYDRPWPTAEPYTVDTSDGFLALGLVGAAAIAVLATPLRRIGIALLAAAGVAICVWSLQTYMPIAGTHWGMRDAMRTYYETRQIYGHKVVYFGEGQLADDWADRDDDTYTFESFIPDTLQVGQPMTVTIQVMKAEDERIAESETVLVGTVAAIGDHSIEITLGKNERQKLAPMIARGGTTGKRGQRAPVRAVDADRLFAWQLYWRGEQFWSGGEIWAWLPEMKVSFVNTNNVEFQKYINDRSRTPLGRRYYVVSEAGRITGIRAMLPTQRARDTFEVIDTTSNKFSLAAFYL